jgi:hypothetical protein
MYGINGIAVAFVISVSIQCIILTYMDKFVLKKNNT